MRRMPWWRKWRLNLLNGLNVRTFSKYVRILNIASLAGDLRTNWSTGQMKGGFFCIKTALLQWICIFRATSLTVYILINKNISQSRIRIAWHPLPQLISCISLCIWYKHDDFPATMPKRKSLIRIYFQFPLHGGMIVVIIQNISLTHIFHYTHSYMEWKEQPIQKLDKNRNTPAQWATCFAILPVMWWHYGGWINCLPFVIAWFAYKHI